MDQSRDQSTAGKIGPGGASAIGVAGSDRRRSPRVVVRRPVKVLHRPTGRYLPAWTIDLSEHGALLEIAWPRPLQPGESVAISIATHGSMVMLADEAIDATVVHALPTKPQIVGVSFTRAAGVVGSRAAA